MTVAQDIAKVKAEEAGLVHDFERGRTYGDLSRWIPGPVLTVYHHISMT